MIPYYSQYAADARLFSNDCGPTCAKMVLSALTGKVYAINELARETTLAARDEGVNIYEVVNIMRQRGVDSRVVAIKSTSELIPNVMAGMPIIAGVGLYAIRGRKYTHDVGHMVVIAGVTKPLVGAKTWKIYDPANGVLRISDAVLWRALNWQGRGEGVVLRIVSVLKP